MCRAICRPIPQRQPPGAKMGQSKQAGVADFSSHAMVTVMANDRLKFAIGRLDRATARVERLIAENRPAVGGEGSDPLLAQRHELLRQQVSTAIKRIDTLIAAAD